MKFLKLRYPEFLRGFAVRFFTLPEWFTKDHAKKVYFDKGFRYAIEEMAKENVKIFGGWGVRSKNGRLVGMPIEYSVSFIWRETVGLQHTTVRPGDASSMGIDFAEWREGEGTVISCHNVDNPIQLCIHYNTWAYYLNGLEIKREHWEKSEQEDVPT